MTAFLRRIAYWLEPQWRRREREARELAEARSELAASCQHWSAAAGAALNDYLADFGPNVPVEDLGGKPVFYENNQPVYPGREKAP